MKILSIITLLLTLASCRTVGFNSSDNDHDNEYMVMGPDYGMNYQDEGASFEFGGSVLIDSYSIHK